MKKKNTTLYALGRIKQDRNIIYSSFGAVSAFVISLSDKRNNPKQRNRVEFMRRKKKDSLQFVHAICSCVKKCFKSKYRLNTDKCLIPTTDIDRHFRFFFLFSNNIPGFSSLWIPPTRRFTARFFMVVAYARS